jgi:two-component system, OmpR family, osmolarity sensor histidine kinase EnvZ
MSIRHLHTRLLLLLTVVVIAALVAAAVAFGLSMRSSNAERIARALHAQVVAADALLALPDRSAALAGLRDLDIAWVSELPVGERPSLPLLVQTESRLGARLPGRPMRLSGTPVQLWVQAHPPMQGWIAIPVLGEGQPLRRGLLFALVAIGVLVLLAAALFARSLIRPLRELAAAAPGIVAGEPPPAAPRFASEEIVELQRALADAAGRTHAAARDRELMLAGISHDMRTPLARLRYALALGDHATDEVMRTGMERDIDELDGIVGQFIDYVRDGRDEPLETVDLIAMLRALAEDEARQGRAWRLGLPNIATLSGRPLALRRALTNLFDNAARHGSAPFEAELDAQGDGWRLRVLDRGPGVPEAALADLGRPFHRVDRARSTSGSGLGLATVTRIAVVHGGGLRLHNREGGGLVAELSLGASSA